MTHLKDEFKLWIGKQISNNGQGFTPNTINAYVTALKNTTAKFNFSDLRNTDIFYINDLNEFETLFNRLTADKRFDSINKAAGNQAFLYGLKQYRQFLIERSSGTSTLKMAGQPEMFAWIEFYTELADELLKYKNNRKLLINKLQSIFTIANMAFPFIENNTLMEDICPFTVFGAFNRGITNENRIKILTVFSQEFGISASIPKTFDGIPVLNNMKAWFFGYKSERMPEDISNLWDVFEAAIAYSDSPSDDTKKTFTVFYDKVRKQLGIKWNITMGLYWIRPNAYLNLDGRNRAYLAKPDTLIAPMGESFNPELTSVPDSSTYLFMCEQCKLSFDKDNRVNAIKSFPALSHRAWLNDNKKDNVIADKTSQEKKVIRLDNISKNIILYGPPGTGKTYNAINYAVAIIEEKDVSSVSSEVYNDVLTRYNSYKDQGLIEFTTFHQSYGYEEFIEGIKPVVENENNDSEEIQYKVVSGIFKTFCENAVRPIADSNNDSFGFGKIPTVWKVSLERTGENPTRRDCLEKGYIRIGWDSYGETINEETDFNEGGKNVLNAFINKMQIGDIVLSCFSSSNIDAVGIVTGEYEWHPEFDAYKRLRKVKWLVRDIRYDITAMNGAVMTLSSVYKLNVSLADVMKILEDTKFKNDKGKRKNHVFIIDEINRGNISKIFGELITLIEPSKRVGQSECIKVKLPYSQKLFGVPDNVFIVGTMNTADRSIALIDTALRRRFDFEEMLPEISILEDFFVEDLCVSDILDTINKRITVLYDREHTIGHAYFMPLKVNTTIETLATIFKNNIIPLLQEYFYEDYEKIRLVLGDNKKGLESEQFIIKKSIDYSELFGNADYDFDDAPTYEINYPAFGNLESYKKI